MGKHIITIGNVRKTLRYLKKNGVRHAYYAARERMKEEKETQYAYREPEEDVWKAQREGWKEFPYFFSIVVPAYETKEEFLHEMITSLLRQSYENWELIIADASKGSRVMDIVRAYQKRDEKQRIRYLPLAENNGISENTNAGIAAARGDYIGLLDHDDVLTKDALYEMAAAIRRAEETEKKPLLLYSDEDKYENDTGTYRDPNRKCKFNLDLILSNNYICHFMMVKADVIKRLKLRKQYDGAQDYDLVLRVAGDVYDAVPIPEWNDRIVHVPKVLYHWRCHEASTAANTGSKEYAYEAGKGALEEFCRDRNWKVAVTHSLHLGFYRVDYEPDIFAMRPEVGIYGGRILDRNNRICSGIFNAEGERLYQGIHKEYSGGSTHRAVLTQDCAAVDIRCIRLNRRMQEIFKEITGVIYREAGGKKLADVSGITCDEEGYRKLSMELGRAAARLGYLVVWDPAVTVWL